MQNEPLPFYITESNGSRRMVGWLKDRIFRKKITGSVHIYRKLDAIGIDAELFKDTLLGQADSIRVLDKETNDIYEASVKLIDEKGQYLHFKPHRAQIFLPRRYWDKSKHEETKV